MVVNISATLHYGATWYQAHASAAKAAVDSLTRSLGLEWGAHNVRVVGIAPGRLVGSFRSRVDSLVVEVPSAWRGLVRVRLWVWRD